MTTFIVRTRKNELVELVAETAPEACTIATDAGYAAMTAWQKQFTYYAAPKSLSRVERGDIIKLER